MSRPGSVGGVRSYPNNTPVLKSPAVQNSNASVSDGGVRSYPNIKPGLKSPPGQNSNSNGYMVGGVRSYPNNTPGLKSPPGQNSNASASDGGVRSYPNSKPGLKSPPGQNSNSTDHAALISNCVVGVPLKKENDKDLGISEHNMLSAIERLEQAADDDDVSTGSMELVDDEKKEPTRGVTRNSSNASQRLAEYASLMTKVRSGGDLKQLGDDKTRAASAKKENSANDPVASVKQRLANLESQKGWSSPRAKGTQQATPLGRQEYALGFNERNPLSPSVAVDSAAISRNGNANWNTFSPQSREPNQSRLANKFSSGGAQQPEFAMGFRQSDSPRSATGNVPWNPVAQQQEPHTKGPSDRFSSNGGTSEAPSGSRRRSSLKEVEQPQAFMSAVGKLKANPAGRTAAPPITPTPSGGYANRNRSPGRLQQQFVSPSAEMTPPISKHSAIMKNGQPLVDPLGLPFDDVASTTDPLKTGDTEKSKKKTRSSSRGRLRRKDNTEPSPSKKGKSKSPGRFSPGRFFKRTSVTKDDAEGGNEGDRPMPNGPPIVDPLGVPLNEDAPMSDPLNIGSKKKERKSAGFFKKSSDDASVVSTSSGRSRNRSAGSLALPNQGSQNTNGSGQSVASTNSRTYTPYKNQSAGTLNLPAQSASLEPTSLSYSKSGGYPIPSSSVVSSRGAESEQFARERAKLADAFSNAQSSGSGMPSSSGARPSSSVASAKGAGATTLSDYKDPFTRDQGKFANVLSNAQSGGPSVPSSTVARPTPVAGTKGTKVPPPVIDSKDPFARDREKFVNALRNAPSGPSSGPSGPTSTTRPSSSVASTKGAEATSLGNDYKDQFARERARFVNALSKSNARSVPENK